MNLIYILYIVTYRLYITYVYGTLYISRILFGGFPSQYDYMAPRNLTVQLLKQTVLRERERGVRFIASTLHLGAEVEGAASANLSVSPLVNACRLVPCANALFGLIPAPQTPGLPMLTSAPYLNCVRDPSWAVLSALRPTCGREQVPKHLRGSRLRELMTNGSHLKQPAEERAAWRASYA